MGERTVRISGSLAGLVVVLALLLGFALGSLTDDTTITHYRECREGVNEGQTGRMVERAEVRCARDCVRAPRSLPPRPTEKEGSG